MLISEEINTHLFQGRVPSPVHEILYDFGPVKSNPLLWFVASCVAPRGNGRGRCCRGAACCLSRSPRTSAAGLRASSTREAGLLLRGSPLAAGLEGGETQVKGSGSSARSLL